MEIGKAIQTIRKSRKLTQAELAEKVGLSQNHLSNIETGEKTTTTDVVKKIAEVLQVPIMLVMWFSVKEEDVAPEKRAAYRMLKPSIDNFLNEIFENVGDEDFSNVKPIPDHEKGGIDHVEED